ncbi:unnamed protein product [marine sediment metagenome]|uniref:Uncharacterized protein n=1 Tax=marine sediment metagenome TaxID=412755 RepID=X1Q248_9ZZZZ
MKKYQKLLNQAMLAPLVNEIIGQYDTRLTVRQIYYRLVAKNIIPNIRSRYNSFDSLLTRLREDGLVDPNRIVDRSRGTIGGESAVEESPEEFLTGELEAFKDCWQQYDLPLWASQSSSIEIWLEKDALSNLVGQICGRYRVLLFPCRGYSSFQMLWEAGGRLKSDTSILYLGDHDPSGLDMEDYIAENCHSNIERIALTREQIDQYKLPAQPVKLRDSRSPRYIAEHGRECWEIDALPPDALQRIIDKAIREYIDQGAWDKRLEEIEEGQEEAKIVLKRIMDDLDTEG